jgi:hypothetical protein
MKVSRKERFDRKQVCGRITPAHNLKAVDNFRYFMFTSYLLSSAIEASKILLTY